MNLLLVTEDIFSQKNDKNLYLFLWFTNIYDSSQVLVDINEEFERFD